MKSDELADKMHQQLFITSTRKGVAEQIMKGKGHFRHLFDKVPVEIHGINNTASHTTCKLRIKPFLIGDDTRS